MRQIATLHDVETARRLADYLLTLDIETRLEYLTEGWAVWVCDEDRVTKAREVLAEFQSNPSDPRYSTAGRDAAERRRMEEAAEEDYRRRQVALRERWGDLGGAPRTLTYTLVVLSVAVGLSTNLGRHLDLRLFISVTPASPASAAYAYLPEVARGEVWRLVTPIFLHFGLLHLLFNMIMLLDIGGQIESRLGTLRYLALVLVLAISSNLAQYYLGSFSLKDWSGLFHPWFLFGGMSGVLYGLFGYLWMKAVHDPASGLMISPTTIIILMAWFLAGLSGFFDSAVGARMANGAHGAGLLAGVVIGYAPHLWKRLTGRE